MADLNDFATAVGGLIKDARPVADPLAPGTDFDAVTTPKRYPVLYSNHPNAPFAASGYLDVSTNGGARRLQQYVTNEPTPRYAERVTSLSGWNAWRFPRTPPPLDTGAYEHMARANDMRRRRATTVKTPGVVVLVFDHGLTKFKASVWPLLQERGLPVTLALNPGLMVSDPRNSGATYADVQAWAATGLVEPANHSYNHTGGTDYQHEIVASRTELETQLGQTIDTWVHPGNTFGDFTVTSGADAYWSTPAGRMILASHGAVTGVLSSGPLPLGQNSVGPNGAWIDAGTGSAQTAVQAAINNGGVQLVRFHPQFLDDAGYITTAQLTAFLDWVKARVDSRELTALTFRDAMSARRAPAPQDTGWRFMPGFAGPAADPARPGQWSLRRRGNRVDCRLIGVGVTGTAAGFLGPNALPAGFTLPANTGRMIEVPSQHGTGVVSTVGDTHKLLFSDNDISWRGVVSSSGTVSTTAPLDHRGLLHGLVSWTTDDPWPTTLPGTPA